MTGATVVQDVLGPADPPYRLGGFSFPTLFIGLRHVARTAAPGTTMVRLTRQGYQDTILCQRADHTWYVQWLGEVL